MFVVVCSSLLYVIEQLFWIILYILYIILYNHPEAILLLLKNTFFLKTDFPFKGSSTVADIGQFSKARFSHSHFLKGLFYLNLSELDMYDCWQDIFHPTKSQVLDTFHSGKECIVSHHLCSRSRSSIFLGILFYHRNNPDDN